jgi:hypothetical protein
MQFQPMMIPNPSQNILNKNQNTGGMFFGALN